MVASQNPHPAYTFTPPSTMTVIYINIYRKKKKKQQPNFQQVFFRCQIIDVKNKFQDGDCGGHIGFLIIPNFDLQVTQILPTKFQVDWPIG